MPGKKVIGAIADDQAIFSRKSGDDLLDRRARAVFVVGALDKELWFGTS
jgi:hypothetical protein